MFKGCGLTGHSLFAVALGDLITLSYLSHTQHIGPRWCPRRILTTAPGLGIACSILLSYGDIRRPYSRHTQPIPAPTLPPAPIRAGSPPMNGPYRAMPGENPCPRSSSGLRHYRRHRYPQHVRMPCRSRPSRSPPPASRPPRPAPPSSISTPAIPTTGEPSPDPKLFLQFLPVIKQSAGRHPERHHRWRPENDGGRTPRRRRWPTKPEMCSLNMGSMNFNISAAGAKRTERKHHRRKQTSPAPWTTISQHFW